MLQNRQHAAEQKQEAQDAAKLDNRFSSANKLISEELASSRTSFGRSANIFRSAEALERLAQQVPDPNNLNGNQIREIAKNLDSMLSNGAGTVSGTDKLIPSTAAGDTMSMIQYITGLPKGKQQGAFVQQMMDTVKREKDLSRDQMTRAQGGLLGGYTDLADKDPDRWATMMQLHGLPVDLIQQKTKDQSQGKAPEPLPTVDRSAGPDGLVTVRRKRDGKTKTLKAIDAQKYLARPQEFEQVQ
jgi:hypothetical protein